MRKASFWYNGMVSHQAEHPLKECEEWKKQKTVWNLKSQNNSSNIIIYLCNTFDISESCQIFINHSCSSTLYRNVNVGKIIIFNSGFSFRRVCWNEILGKIFFLALLSWLGRNEGTWNNNLFQVFVEVSGIGEFHVLCKLLIATISNGINSLWNSPNSISILIL